MSTRLRDLTFEFRCPPSAFICVCVWRQRVVIYGFIEFSDVIGDGSGEAMKHEYQKVNNNFIATIIHRRHQVIILIKQFYVIMRIFDIRAQCSRNPSCSSKRLKRYWTIFICSKHQRFLLEEFFSFIIKWFTMLQPGTVVRIFFKSLNGRSLSFSAWKFNEFPTNNSSGRLKAAQLSSNLLAISISSTIPLVLHSLEGVRTFICFAFWAERTHTVSASRKHFIPFL